MPDHYTYPGSDVLVNKLGIMDYEHWKFVETEVIGQRMGELRVRDEALGLGVEVKGGRPLESRVVREGWRVHRSDTATLQPHLQFPLNAATKTSIWLQRCPDAATQLATPPQRCN